MNHRVIAAGSGAIGRRLALLSLAAGVLASCAGSSEPSDAGTSSATTSTPTTAAATTSTPAPVPPTKVPTSEPVSTPPATLASPPTDPGLAAAVPEIAGYRMGAPEPNTVPWPQFELPADVTVHAVAIGTVDRVLGALVVVAGLDAVEHVDTVFEDAVQLTTSSLEMDTGTFYVSNGAVPMWRDHGVPVIEATLPDDDTGQWLWTHDELTWIATGSLDMARYVDELIAEQQRDAPAGRYDYAVLAGPVWDRLVKVPGYTYTDLPVADALAILPRTSAGECAQHVYYGASIPRDVPDPLTVTPDALVIVATEVAARCADRGFFDDLAARAAAVGMTAGEIAGVPVTQNSNEIMVVQDGMLLHLTSQSPEQLVAMAPFIERFVAGGLPDEVLDLTPMAIPTCLYRETEAEVERAGAERRTFVTDCATPHQGELYHHGSISGDASAAYRGEAAVDADADRQCSDAFAPYVGRDLASSRLSYLYFFPTQQMWAQGDRGVECVLFAGDGEELVRGSLQGTAQ